MHKLYRRWSAPLFLGCTLIATLLVCGELNGVLGAPTAPTVPAAARPSAHFDPQAATDAWLASVPAADRARSDAYFEGGYWLTLWDFLSLAAVMILLLETGLTRRMRDLASRITHRRWPKNFIYWLEFAVVTGALLFPLNLYESFFREHQYGLSNQNFSGWLGDYLTGSLVALLLGGLAVATIFLLVQKLPASWHIWGAVAAVVFSALTVLIAPVFIAPLFNKYKPLENGAIKAQILSLAHANGIPVNDVYEVDASRQSKRVSANVSGFLGTDRITLNDNLLARCSPQSVMSVMGHEMGHYVMHHIWNGLVLTAVMLTATFGLLRYFANRAIAARGRRWQISEIGDIAALPLAVLILAAISLLSTPIGNTATRMQEYEADIFGLDAARQPDGEAEADLLLGEYRKLDPSPLEELVFFDHPSGRTRIYAAMRWKAENLCLFDASLPCANQPASLPKSAPTAASGPTAAQLR